MKITTLNQLQAGISRLNSNMKNYIRSIQSVDNGVNFIDGNGNVVFTLSNSNAVEKQDPNLTLSSYSLEPNTNKTITATFSGNGTISVSSVGTYYFNYQVSGNSITFTPAPYEALDTVNGVDESYIVTLSETDEYESDTAVVKFYVAGTTYDEEEDDDDEEE